MDQLYRADIKFENQNTVIMLTQNSQLSENRYYGLDKVKLNWLRKEAKETFDVKYIDIDEWKKLEHL